MLCDGSQKTEAEVWQNFARCPGDPVSEFSERVCVCLAKRKTPRVLTLTFIQILMINFAFPVFTHTALHMRMRHRTLYVHNI